jgi:hypothetical protein
LNKLFGLSATVSVVADGGDGLLTTISVEDILDENFFLKYANAFVFELV